MDVSFQAHCALRLPVKENRTTLEQRRESILRQKLSHWVEPAFHPKGGDPLLFSVHLAAQMAGKLIGGKQL